MGKSSSWEKKREPVPITGEGGEQTILSSQNIKREDSSFDGRGSPGNRSYGLSSSVYTVRDRLA